MDPQPTAFDNPLHIAPYFAGFTAFNEVRVLPPWESKDRPAQWVRGSLRVGSQDLVVTGPKLKVCFSGCRWNRLVLAMNGVADEQGYAFQRWVENLAAHVQNTIWAAPEKYKSGSKTNARFTFDYDIVKPSSDPALYPDQLSTRLSVHRLPASGGDEGEFLEVVDADLYRLENSVKFAVEPSEITAGSYVVPVIRFSYSRNVERFGLVMTVLKAHVFPSEQAYKVENTEWIVDYPMDQSL